MENENDKREASSGDVASGAQGLSAGRRRLLRGGLGAAPVLMSFVSQPVSATYSCKSASAYTSANASRPSVSQCNGASPTWWRNNTGSWTGCSTSTRFDAYFSATTRYPAGKTLRQVLDGPTWIPSWTDTDVDKMARNLVAALLNAKSGRIGGGVFDDATLKKIWVDANGSGGYVPSPGAPGWNAAGVNTWLATVFPVAT